MEDSSDEDNEEELTVQQLLMPQEPLLPRLNVDVMELDLVEPPPSMDCNLTAVLALDPADKDSLLLLLARRHPVRATPLLSCPGLILATQELVATAIAQLHRKVVIDS